MGLLTDMLCALKPPTKSNLTQIDRQVFDFCRSYQLRAGIEIPLGPLSHYMQRQEIEGYSVNLLATLEGLRTRGLLQHNTDGELALSNDGELEVYPL